MGSVLAVPVLFHYKWMFFVKAVDRENTPSHNRCHGTIRRFGHMQGCGGNYLVVTKRRRWMGSDAVMVSPMVPPAGEVLSSRLPATGLLAD